MSGRLNVLGTALERCSRPGGPVTGFYRDGCCTTGENDFGRHVVCSKMTQMFLAFSRQQGNDLITPAPEYGFPGLKPGDFWCLCASRWAEAEVSDCCRKGVMSVAERGSYTSGEAEFEAIHSVLVAGQYASPVTVSSIPFFSSMIATGFLESPAQILT